eukprot:g960.t1
MYASYAGALYAVKRASDGATKDIAANKAGFADSAAQDKFCSATDCVIQRIFDQTPNMNHLDIAPPGGAHRAEDAPTNATAAPLTVGGNRVYSAYFEGGMGYRIDNTTNIAKGDEPETIFAVLGGKHFNNG